MFRFSTSTAPSRAALGLPCTLSSPRSRQTSPLPARDTDVLETLAAGFCPVMPLTVKEMESIRDEADDIPMFEIGGRKVTEYMLAAAYCDYLRGDKAVFEAFSRCIRQLQCGMSPDRAARDAADHAVDAVLQPLASLRQPARPDNDAFRAPGFTQPASEALRR